MLCGRWFEGLTTRGRILLQSAGTRRGDPACFLIQTADNILDANPSATWCLRSSGLAGGCAGCRTCGNPHSRDHVALLTTTFDRRLMKLAIKQLLDNALKYSPSETLVEIQMHGKNAILTMEITDHGEGIAVEEQTQIFDRFFRSPSIKNQIPGSGLGLSIAHRIVQAHSGKLTVSSQPGQTTFRITLPVLKQVIP